MSAPDRVELIRLSNTLTGLDFVQVSPDQLQLFVFVHHLTLPPALAASLATIVPGDVDIRAVGKTAPAEVPVVQHVLPIVTTGGRRALHFTVAAPGGFGDYWLRIAHPAIDTYFNNLEFSFKANCPTELDCKTEEECPREPSVDFPVDYRARDFWSFRQALTDFAAQRYPDWQDRLEADQGMVHVELLSALGDEFAYANDRIAREHSIGEASQRRSLRHLAGLVDYPIDNGCGALAWVDVEATMPGALAGGEPICDGNHQVVFEIGRGLVDTGVSFVVSNARNTFQPYIWDEDDVCLESGSTTLTLSGHHAASLVLDPLIDPVGKWMLLETVPTDPARPERRLMVRVVDAVDTTDPLNGNPITNIEWDEPTPFDLDRETLRARGNLVPATSGKTTKVQFRIGPTPPGGAVLPQAIERVGPNHDLTDQPDEVRDEDDIDTALPERRIKYLFSLEGSETTALVWLEAGDVLRPEVLVTGPGSSTWNWTPALIGAEVASPTDPVFTLEEGTYRMVFSAEEPGGRFEFEDYASSDGWSIRLGDGEFGEEPNDGDVFDVAFRLGNGRLMNVAADTLKRFVTEFDDPPSKPAFVASITNPLAACGGRDPETADSIRTNAPEAFRRRTFRAVRPEDHAEIAERLPWVQKTGASLRWTGSWATVFVTPDVRNEVGLSLPHRLELEAVMDRVRQAGRDVRVLDPTYADIDLEIHVCVNPDAYPGEVKGRVLVALFGDADTVGFFDEDNFTFGTPLSRGALMAAIQAVPGVKAVEQMRVRRRGHFGWRAFDEFALRVSQGELIRIVNDRELPEQGAVRLVMEGGA